MGHNKKASSRRDFLSLFMNKKNNDATGTIKMLTADGKLVEIDRAALDEAREKKKASNQDIYHWMNNPSKES